MKSKLFKKIRKKEDIKIVIFPDEQHEPMSFSVKRRTVALLVAVIIALTVFYIIGAVTYFPLVKIAVNYNELEGENKILLQQLKKLNRLEKEFAQIKKYKNKVKDIIGDKIKIPAGNEYDTTEITIISSIPSTIYNFIPHIMPVNGYISRLYDDTEHQAIDIAAKSGTPVMATANGKVVFAGWNSDFGNVVIIAHGHNIFSVYKHNLRNLVKEKQIVTAGQVIALLGDTGEISSGPHLHFEIWDSNVPADPMKFVSQR